MSAGTIVASGGFNTGRLYAANGQEVFWWLMSTNKVVFFDRSRMIIGETDDAAEPDGIAIDMQMQPHMRQSVARWIMQQYDGGRYGMACQPARIPADFDFGAPLRV